MLKIKQGQSSIEYLVLVTAVIVVLIVLVGRNNSFFRQTLTSTHGQATGVIQDVSGSWR